MQARGNLEANRGVLAAVGQTARLRLALAVAIAAFCFAAWAGYELLRLAQAPLVVPLVALASVGAAVATTVPYWSRVLAHARGEHAATSETTRS